MGILEAILRVTRVIGSRYRWNRRIHVRSHAGTRYPLLKIWAIAAVATMLVSCGSSQTDKKTAAVGKVPSGPRLVILYATCSVNKDYLSPYNEDVLYTPHLKEFAKDSLVFSKHHTEAGQSGIAYASLFSGAQADHHGIYLHPRRFREDLYSITEAFADNGYDVHFWNHHGMAAPELGYAQGVEEKNLYHKALAAKDYPFKKILKKLKEDPLYKAFILTNFTITHGPYTQLNPGSNVASFMEEYPSETIEISPDEFQTYRQLYLENERDLVYDLPTFLDQHNLNEADFDRLCRTIELMYKECINDLDRRFGEVLTAVQEAGFQDDSLIAFTTDHGEVLFRENALIRWTHGFQLAPEVHNVPLIIRAPKHGVSPGNYDGVTRSIDVFPTMLGVCGIAVPEDQGIQGVDLSNSLQAGQNRTDLLAYSHTSLLSEIVEASWKKGTALHRAHNRLDPNRSWVAVRKRDMFYTLRNRDGDFNSFEVYDLAVDPTGTDNLADPKDPDHQEMQKKLQAYRQRLAKGYAQSRSRAISGDQQQPSDAEKVRRLKSLGYID